MAQGINKVILIGNVGQDPETRYSQSGFCFTSLSLATSESWKDKNTGQKQERTEWHRVSIQGKLGEISGEYVKKGSKIYVEGKLQTRKWQDQSGQDRYTTEIVVDSFNGVMQMLGGKQDSAQTSEQARPTQESRSVTGLSPRKTQAPDAIKAQKQPDPGFDDFDSDIPF